MRRVERLFALLLVVAVTAAFSRVEAQVQPIPVKPSEVKPEIVYTADGKCKLEKPITTPKRKPPIFKLAPPAPVASAASAPKKIVKKKPKPKIAKPVVEDEYVPCPPLKPPGLFSLIPPPDDVPEVPFPASIPPEGLYAVPSVPTVPGVPSTPEPCGCFAEGGGGFPVFVGYPVGGGGGGGFAPPSHPITSPVPEPHEWALMLFGLAFIARRARHA